MRKHIVHYKLFTKVTKNKNYKHPNMSNISLRKRVTRNQTKDINNYQVTSKLDAYTDTSSKTQEVTITPTSSNKKQKTKGIIDVSHISNDNYKNTYTAHITSQSHDMEINPIVKDTTIIT
jgi:hypothetical protein